MKNKILVASGRAVKEGTKIYTKPGKLHETLWIRVGLYAALSLLLPILFFFPGTDLQADKSVDLNLKPWTQFKEICTEGFCKLNCKYDLWFGFYILADRRAEGPV